MREKYSTTATGWDSTYPTTPAPNLYIPVAPESMIDRKGEKFLWIRMLPSLDVGKGNLALPDGKYKGYIPTYEKTRKILNDSIQLFHQNPAVLETALSPIHSIENLYIFRDKFSHGGNIQLTVKSFKDNIIEIEPCPELIECPYLQVNIDYTVKTYETIEEQFEQTEDGSFLRINLNGNLLVKVNSIWMESESGEFIEIKNFGRDYTKIRLPRVVEKGRKFNLSYDVISPISIAYRTIDGKDEMLNDKSIGVQVGDLEGLVSPVINISKGDIIISTLAVHNEKELIYKGENGKYRLKYLPAVDIDQVVGAEREYSDDEYYLEDMQYIVFPNLQPHELPNAISVIYGFHPAYRVTNSVSLSALAGKRQPKKWIFRPDFSNVILDKGD